MSEERPPADVFDLLGDEYVRAILTATSREPLSAKALSDECDMSVSTVYRRVEDLVEQGLIEERTHIASDGHHYTVYAAAIDHMDVDLEDGEFQVQIQRPGDAVDRFTRVWEDIRGT